MQTFLKFVIVNVEKFTKSGKLVKSGFSSLTLHVTSDRLCSLV